MARKTGYITKTEGKKERVVFYYSTISLTEAIKDTAKRTSREINKRYGKGTAYARPKSKGSQWYSVFIRR